MSALSPRGLRVLSAVRWLLVALSVVVAATSWWSWLHAAGPEGSEASRPKYQCPMHPSIVSNEPGTCPICGMQLEPITSTRNAETPPAAATTMDAAAAPAVEPRLPDGGTATYFCPMHPEIRSAEPGRCPICKMKLEPIPASIIAKAEASAHGDAGPPLAPPTGVAPITLTLDRMQAIGVRTAIATEKLASDPIRATASVATPEQGVAEVHVRSPGFVERIAVRETGARVTAGQELFALYSPEIYQSETELVASRAVAAASGAGTADAGLLGESRVIGAARTRLELLGMSSRAIDEVLATGKPLRAVSVVAPSSGWVTRKNVVLGSYVTPETTLYEIVDLSRVYVVADVLPADAPDVHVGSHAHFTVTGRSELEAQGSIDLVYPRTNPEARTTRVRMQLANTDRRFVPGQYGMMHIDRATRKGVFVPRDAVIDTGEQAYVFVDLGGGALAPRRVEVGRAQGDELEILRGVAAGDRVVAGATFLVDSESRLRAALAQAQSPQGAADAASATRPPEPAPTSHQGH